MTGVYRFGGGLMAVKGNQHLAMEPPRQVELHSHDFEWEELARACRLEESEGDEGRALGAEELADEAKGKWDAFHARNKGSCGCWLVAMELSRAEAECRGAAFGGARQSVQAPQLPRQGVPGAAHHGE